MINLLVLIPVVAFVVAYIPGFVVQVALAFATGRTIFLLPAIIVDAMFPFPGAPYVPVVTLTTILALVIRRLLRKYIRV